jgi:broad specificity phosphatase PhoE
MQKIKIIRHGERLDYTYPVYWLLCIGQYWADSPLTKRGHTIAKNKGKDIARSRTFSPSYIYSSPYNRTLATATEIKSNFANSQLMIEPLLSEYQPYFKHKIGLYPNGLPTTYEGLETGFTYPENHSQFINRTKFILNNIIKKHDKDILIVTHGEILKTFIVELQNRFPSQKIDAGKTPYLTILSFDLDGDKNIIEDSICIE